MLTLHPHWKILLWPAVLLVVLIVAAVALLIVIPPGREAGPGRIAVGVVAFILAVAACGVPFLRWKTTTYQLTTRRIQLRRGILTRSGRDFPLIRISDVAFSQGPIDRLVGSGNSWWSPRGSTASWSCTRSPTFSRSSPGCSSWSRTSSGGWPRRNTRPPIREWRAANRGSAGGRRRLTG